MGTQIKEGFLTAEQARRILHVKDETLRAWANEGKIEFTRAPGKFTHRRYNVKKFIEERDGEKQTSTPAKVRRKIIYGRVSTRGQKENLQRQIDFLREGHPDHELITDIASGINFKRKGLQTILDLAIRGELEEVVVTHKDRLSRFGFDHFEYLYKQLSNAKVVVLNHVETSLNEELVEDVLSVVTVFSAKINGRKKYGKRKGQETPKDNEDTYISFEETEENPK